MMVVVLMVPIVKGIMGWSQLMDDLMGIHCNEKLKEEKMVDAFTNS